MGRIESGHILAGAEVVVLPSGRAHARARDPDARRAARDRGGRRLGDAGAGRRHRSSARGDLIADAQRAAARDARACRDAGLARQRAAAAGRRATWCSRRARRVAGQGADARPRPVDLERHRRSARLSLFAPLFVDRYDAVRVDRLAHPDRRSHQPDRRRRAGAMTAAVSSSISSAPGRAPPTSSRCARPGCSARRTSCSTTRWSPRRSCRLLPRPKRSRSASAAAGIRPRSTSSTSAWSTPRAATAVVVRLKGGDPMLFGRAHEEIACLQQTRHPRRGRARRHRGARRRRRARRLAHAARRFAQRRVRHAARGRRARVLPAGRRRSPRPTPRCSTWPRAMLRA